MADNHRYAIVNNATGHVENITVWDGDATKWQPPQGTKAILLPDNSQVSPWNEGAPGWTYDGTDFHPPLTEESAAQ